MLGAHNTGSNKFSMIMAQNLTSARHGDYYIPDIRLAHMGTQQLAWVAHMNSLKAQKEEIILQELIYGEDAV